LPCGRIAYVEQGRGPVAVFLHGVPLNGFHWRHVMAGLSDARCCIALDLMSVGYTEIETPQAAPFALDDRTDDSALRHNEFFDPGLEHDRHTLPTQAVEKPRHESVTHHESGAAFMMNTVRQVAQNQSGGV